MALNREYALYTYKLSKLDKSERVKFVYALKGRGEMEGLVRHYKGKFLAPACFIVPIRNDVHIREIFKQWKTGFKRYHIQFMENKD